MKKYLIIIPILVFLLVASLIVIYRKPNDNILPIENNIAIQETKEESSEENTLADDIFVLSQSTVKDEIEVVQEDEPSSTENVKEDTTISTEPSSTTDIASPPIPSSTPSTTPIINTTDTVVEEKKEIKKESKVDETIPKEQEENTNPSIETNTETSPQKETPPAEPKQEIKRCTSADNHGIEVGNTGKWFSTKDEAIAYYKNEVKKWSDFWEAADPEDTEADAMYYKNCPTGYEVISCMYCSKWTIDFHYR